MKTKIFFVFVLLLLALTPAALAQQDGAMVRNNGQKATNGEQVMAREQIHAKEGLAVSAEATAKRAIAVRNNRPDYKPGYDMGYFIWQNGRNIHICWSGDSRNYDEDVITEEASDVGREGWHNFAGTITTDGYFFVTVAGLYEFKQGDTYTADQSEITFDANAGPHQDCLVFRTTGKEVTFDLTIDGEQNTEAVYLNKAKNNPNEMPFTLSLLTVESVKDKVVEKAKELKAKRPGLFQAIKNRLFARRAALEESAEETAVDLEEDSTDEMEELSELLEESYE